MRELEEMFERNREWAKGKLAADPEVFERGAKGQAPKMLWIGCADSRVPPNVIMGLEPGEVFVHRNIANLCPKDDLNFLSVLQYAVDHLKVEHIVVCGHTCCGGVIASLGDEKLGLIDDWLEHIRDVAKAEKEKLQNLSMEEKQQKLVELNVLHQVKNVTNTPTVQNALKRGQSLKVHGWVYDLKTGLLEDLNCCKNL